jgi:hypothetical protein
MKKNWIALAAVTAFAAVPAMAQMDMTTTSADNSTMSTMYTNVDQSGVRSDLDKLGDYLTRISENSRLQAAAGDIVQADAYRRMNVVLLDNATAIAMNASDKLGPATAIPPGWGLTRDYVADVNAHLAHARMTADYTTPIAQARMALDMANQATTNSSMGMSGSMSQ